MLGTVEEKTREKTRNGVRRLRKTPAKTAVSLLSAMVTLGASVWAGQSVSSPRSVWDGVYTPAQAARGKAVYDSTCSSCHRSDLGGAEAGALKGDRFWQNWGEDTLSNLYNLAKSTMPRNAASLPDENYLDIVAYILQANGYPAGEAELTAGTVDGIRITGKDGPGPVPNFALVSVVGCLARNAAGVWSVTNSTEPVRTRAPDPSQGSDRQRAVDTALGPHTFELMDVYRAGDGHQGHRMEVKGLLIRGPINKVNVTSMQMLGADCQP
jgi:mono/diheme cytochrome c family protein